MAHRLALILVLLTAASASAQDLEIEAGAGIWTVNPLGFDDFDRRAKPSVSAAWTNWCCDSERSGWSVGVIAIPFYGHGGYASQSFIFGHVTWRHRWFHDHEGDFTHVGIGAGPLLWYVEGSRSSPWHLRALGHVEAQTTRRIRDGLTLRAGVTFTPLLHIPIFVQPVVMAVWSR